MPKEEKIGTQSYLPSRREFLRRSVALGLSVPTVSALLAACGGGDDDDESAATSPSSSDATPTAAEVLGDETESEATGDEAQSMATSADAATTGGQAIISMGEPDTLLSIASRSATAGMIYSFIANGLTKPRLPSMEIVEDLAESWEVSLEGTSYTFTLRQDVRWQDGQPFSIEDVKFTFELWAHRDYPGPLEPDVAIIEGAQAYKDGQAEEITGIKVVDENHVRFTLTRPNALFLATVATTGLLPRHILEDVSPADVQNHEFARQPVYTGPFMLDEWRTGDSITYRAFPDHFAGRPNLDTIVARNIPDEATAIAELQAGGVQMSFVQSDQFGQFAEDEAFHTQELSGAAGWFLEFDLTNQLFSDPPVRKAMSHAIDRQAVLESLFRGKAESNFSIASPLSWVYNPDIPKFEFDVEQAKALLNEAGWTPDEDGVRVKDGQRLSFTMNVTNDTEQWATVVQPFLEEIGIQYEINLLEFGTWIDQLVVGKYEGSVGGWFNFIIDPRADLQQQFESPRPEDATGYNNEQVNELFKQARATIDRDEQKKLYDQIQEITAEDAVYVYLWRPQNLLVIGSKLAVPAVKVESELYARAPEWGLQS